MTLPLWVRRPKAPSGLAVAAEKSVKVTIVEFHRRHYRAHIASYQQTRDPRPECGFVSPAGASISNTV